jgi:hypothetical protein
MFKDIMLSEVIKCSEMSPLLAGERSHFLNLYRLLQISTADYKGAILP